MCTTAVVTVLLLSASREEAGGSDSGWALSSLPQVSCWAPTPPSGADKGLRLGVQKKE